MTQRLSFYAPCARGIEPLLAEELRRLRLKGVRPQRGGVLFAGSIQDSYRALLWSRLASRVLLSLGELDATTAESLYDSARSIAWEDHVAASGTIAVDASGTNPALRNTQFTAVRLKDAVVDRLRERAGERPSVDTASPDVRINVVVTGDKAKLAIDLSGTPLHRRGYREQGVQVTAPMKETLAAAVLEVAGWRDAASRGEAFLDPLCGSATLVIEAAWMAGEVAPGLLRSDWGFDGWLGHDSAAWQRLLDKADERAEAGLAAMPPIAGSDVDARAIEVARRCVKRAGLDRYVELQCAALTDATAPGGSAHGLLATNPPYGERISDRRGLPVLYGEMSRVLRERFAQWDLAVITSDESLPQGLSLRPAIAHDLMNGRIPTKVYVFKASAGGGGASGSLAGPGSAVTPQRDRREVCLPPKAADTPQTSSKEAPAPPETQDPFRNRLAKMAKHFGTWARRTGVTCYRVYDADLPDYNVAIDVYQGAGEDAGRTWVHLAEYAPPAGIDEVRASQRLDHATAVAADVFGASPRDVFVKRRQRQRGASQYERVGSATITATIAESGLLFEVNLSDYLDTGIFLDHRDTRAWLRELASGKSFLNLFAYTGTASVYAAAGAATSTTTVDLSQTYLDWATRNMTRNGFGGDEHSIVRADVLAWVDEARRGGQRYDLIFCDPPTFSNSKRMDETWDVQRDHVALLNACAKLLTEDGLIVFSCNRKRFVLDADSLSAAGLASRDVTRRTIPKDFDRSTLPHTCWTVKRA